MKKPGPKSELDKPEIKERIKNLRRKGLTYSQLVEVLDTEEGIKITTEGLRHRFGIWRKRGDTDIPSDLTKTNQGPTPDGPALLNSRIYQLEKENAILRSRTRNTSDYFLSLLGEYAVKPVVPFNIRKGRRKKINQALHTIWSDWHYGSFVNPDETLNLGEFSSEIAMLRLEKLVEKTLQFKYEDCSNHVLDKLTIFNLGDMSDGFALRDSQAYNIDRQVVDQLFELGDMKIKMIQTLCKHFSIVEEFCIPGNHPRLTRKKDGLPPRNNFDYILNRQVKRLLRDQENYHCYVSESPRMIISCGDHNFCLSHGDHIRAYQGTPYYGIERDFRRLGDLAGMVIHYALYGDKHVQTNLGDRMIINGNLVGGSAYAINQLTVTCRPSQKIWYFHDKEGANRYTDLYLAPWRILEKDEKGIYTPHS